MARWRVAADSSGLRAAFRSSVSAADLSNKSPCWHHETKSAYEFKYSRVERPRFPPTVFVKSSDTSPPTNWNFFGELVVVLIPVLMTMPICNLQNYICQVTRKALSNRQN